MNAEAARDAGVVDEAIGAWAYEAREPHETAFESAPGSRDPASNAVHAREVRSLVHGAAARVGRIARKLAKRDDERADELTQIGMEVICESARQHVGLTQGAFMQRVVKRVRGAMLDALIRDWRATKIGDEVEAAGMQSFVEPAAPESPEAALARAQRDHALEAAITELPEELRALVRGYYWEERTLAELGREHGVSTATAWRRVEEGVAVLRRALRRAGIDG